MTDSFLDRVKRVFGQASRSGSVRSTVKTARETASDLGNTAQQAAKDVAGRARATVADLGDKDRPADRAASSTGNRANLEAAHQDTHVADDGLSESAQATIDNARQRANASIRAASFELENAADNTPGDAADVATGREVDATATFGDVDNAARNAKTDQYQE